MKTKIILILIMISCACKSTNNVMQVSDQQIALQVVSLDESDNEVSFKARVVVTSKDLVAKLSSAIAQKMTYQSDSIFYITNGKQKIFPALIQPVANGVANTFEYLIDFDCRLPEKGLVMVYSDQYLTKKTYQLILN